MKRFKRLGAAVILLTFLCMAGTVLADDMTEGETGSSEGIITEEQSTEENQAESTPGSNISVSNENDQVMPEANSSTEDGATGTGEQVFLEEGETAGSVDEPTEGTGEQTLLEEGETAGSSGEPTEGTGEQTSPEEGETAGSVDEPTEGTGEQTSLEEGETAGSAGEPTEGTGEQTSLKEDETAGSVGDPTEGIGEQTSLEEGETAGTDQETPAAETPVGGETMDSEAETVAAAEQMPVMRLAARPATVETAPETTVEEAGTETAAAENAKETVTASTVKNTTTVAAKKTTAAATAKKTTTAATAKKTTAASAAKKTVTTAAPKAQAKTAVAKQLLPNGWYVIHSAIDNKRVLDIRSGSTANGANVQIYAGNNSDAQIFRLVYDAKTGTYRITNRKSGKAISTASSSKANGVNVNQVTVSSSAQQQWVLESVGNNVYRLVNKATGKVLDVQGARNVNSANVQTYQGNKSAAQGWVFTMLNASQMQAFSPLPDEWFTISSSKNVGKVVDIASGSVRSGANVQLYETNGTDAQKFRFVYDYNTDSYKIINKKSGKALTIAGNTKGNGNVNQSNDAGQLGQLWQVRANKNGTYTLVSRLSGRALDLYGGRTNDKTNIQVYGSNNSAAQHWIIQPAVNTSCEKILGNGVYYIASALNGTKVLDVSGGSRADGANVQLYEVNNTKAQQFRLTYDSKTKTYTIVNVNSSQALNLSRGGKSTGTNVNQGKMSNGRSAQQRWTIQKTEDGYFTIVSSLSGKVLDAKGGRSANGTNVQSYYSNESDAQKWQILKASGNYLPGNGVYEISSALDSSLIVGVSGESMSEDANIQLQADGNKDAQRFALTRESDGTYRVNNYNSGKLLTPAGSAAESNAQQELSTESRNQRWVLKDAGNGMYYLQNAQTGKYLESASIGAASGTNVQVNNGSGTTAQKFYIKKQSIKPVANGTYNIATAAGSQVMDVEAGSRKVNAEIQTWSNNNSTAQKFQIKMGSDGYYTITNVKSKHAVGVYGQSMLSGMPLHQEAVDGSLAQKWLLHKNANGTYSFINARDGLAITSGGKGSAMKQENYTGNSNRQFRLKSTSGKDTAAVDKSIEDGTVDDTMLSNANKYTSKTNYMVVVDRDNFRTNVYTGKKGYWKQIQSYLCSVGAPGHETTPGLTEIKENGRNEYFTSGYGRLYWPSRLTNGRILHSVMYYENASWRPGPLYDGTLGARVSMGCVRLAIENAKWIYDNVPYKSAVYIY